MGEFDINELLKQINELQAELKSAKKYGLVWDKENIKEDVVLHCENNIPVLNPVQDNKILCGTINNLLIEGDNFHSLLALNFTIKNSSDVSYIDPPYTNFGWFPAKMDDLLNFIPARLSALLMLFAGWILRLDLPNGWRIFCRDRYKHASPNSAQTEAVCAGLLNIQLAGDAWYHGILHKKQFIGDPIREIEYNDIPRSCRLEYLTALFMLIICCGIKLMLLS